VQVHHKTYSCSLQLSKHQSLSLWSLRRGNEICPCQTRDIRVKCLAAPSLAHDSSHLNIVVLLESVNQHDRANRRPPPTALTTFLHIPASNCLLRRVQLSGLVWKHLSDFGGEIEESCLLACHFYLPEKKTSIYVHLALPEAALVPEAVLTPRTCSAKPLRTGEYNQYV
jgi:hypothetical protein